MAKRINWNTMKIWAPKIGIPVGIAGFVLLFMYLNSLGVIDVTSYSGDMICAGTIENPCVAYVNFSVKEDIFLYPIGYDPYGRDTPFYTDVGLESWKMYRSWGKGWREIKLNETCPGTWCGAPNNKGVKYSFVFREGRDYRIKIVVLKEDPTQDIKWGFGPVDPVFLGINEDNIFIELIENRASIVGGESIFEINLPVPVDISKALSFDFALEKGNLKRHEIYLNYSERYEVPINGEITQIKNCTRLNNETFSGEIYDCSETSNYISGYDTRYKEGWKKAEGIISGVHKIKLVGYWNSEGIKLDWIPKIKFTKEELGLDKEFVLVGNKWAWWDVGYNFRRNITGMEEKVVISINGTNTTTLNGVATSIYGTGNNSPAIYYNDETDHAIANDTDEFYKLQTLPAIRTSGTRPSSLTAYLPFDNSEAGKGINYAGKNATYNSGITQNVDVGIGKSFTSSSGNLNISGSQPFSGAKGTVLFRLQPSLECAAADRILFSDYSTAYVCAMTPGSELSCRVGGGAHPVHGSCVGKWSVGDWIEFVFTWDTIDDEYAIYLNKELLDYDGATDKTASTLDHLFINGYRGTTQYFDGNYTSFVIYDRVLSSAEINASYDLASLEEREEPKVDIIPPNVTINTPLNQTYPTNLIVFNVTAVDETSMKDCNYTLNSGNTNYTMTNASTSPTYWNATNSTMVQGSSTVLFYCRDVINNLNNSETVTFFIDTIKPDINITFPINNTNHSNSNLDVNFTRSDTNLFNCWYSNDTYLKNTSLTTNCNNITSVVWSEGQHSVTVWANDTAGNINNSKISFTIDSINPEMVFDYPNNISYNIEVTKLNYTYTETNPGYCWRSDDGGDTVSAPITMGINWTGLTSSEESNTWTIYCNDTVGNSNSTNMTFTVDRIKPDLNITFPQNNTNWTNVNLDVNFTRSDINLAYCWYSNDTYSKNTFLAGCGNLTDIVWSEGQHNVTVWANDTAGNENVSRISFRIDITPPITTAVATSPPDGDSYTFNTWADEDVKVTMSSIDLGVGVDTANFPKYCTDGINTCDPNTFISTGVTISTEGVSYIRYNASDKLGNAETINSKIVRIDSINPDLNITFPQNNSNTSNVNLDVNYTTSDTNLAYCWYSNDSYSKVYNLATCGTNITTIVWSEGQHNVTVWANDSAGNINASNVSFTIDTTNPDLNITFPINNTNWTNINLDVNFTRSDTTLHNCWYSNDTYKVNITLPDCGNITNVVWSYAQHNVTVWANDSIGNMNRSKISFLIFLIEEDIPIREVELGSNVNITANSTFDKVCVDIDHPDYGINYSCSSDVSIAFNISYFRTNTLGSGALSVIKNWTNRPFFNASFINITSHQYAEVDYMSLNISGLGKPRDITFYKVNTTDFDRVYMGYLTGNLIYLNKTCDSSGNGICVGHNNLTFSNPGSLIVYFYLDDNLKDVSFTLNVSGELYGFEFNDTFENYDYIDNSLTTTQLDLSGTILPPNSTYKEFVYDDFEDGIIDTDAVWRKIDDFSYTATCSYSGTTTEPNGDLKQQVIWSDSGDVCSGTVYMSLWSNETALNMYNSDNIKFKLNSIYSGGDRGCAGYTFVSVGGNLLWTSSILAGSSGAAESTETKRMAFNFTKVNTTSWSFQISGEEHASTYVSPNDVDLYTNWTNGTWRKSVGGVWTSGYLINDGYFSVNYDTYQSVLINSSFQDGGSCSGGSQVTYIHYVNNSKWKRTNGTVVSESVFDSSGDITDATLSAWGYNNPYETLTPYLSADGGTTWEAVTWQVKHVFAVPGKHIKWRVDFSDVYSRYENKSSYITKMKINTTQSNPSNITFDFGDDKTTNYTIGGWFNSTNGTITLDLSSHDLTNSFTTKRTFEGSIFDHTYIIPLVVYSDSKGYVNLDFFNLTYDPNPISLNTTLVQSFLSNSSGKVNFSIGIGNYFGNITIDDIRFDYAGGNDTINITIHSPDYSGYINQTNITVWYSRWDWAFGSGLVDYLEFLPKTPSSRNVSAYRQTLTESIFSVTDYGYGGRDANLSIYLNDTLPCVNLTMSTTNDKSDGFIINDSWLDLYELSYLDTVNLWMWADYSCDYSTWKTFNPFIYFRQCCENCTCSEDLE